MFAHTKSICHCVQPKILSSGTLRCLSSSVWLQEKKTLCFHVGILLYVRISFFNFIPHPIYLIIKTELPYGLQKHFVQNIVQLSIVHFVLLLACVWFDACSYHRYDITLVFFRCDSMESRPPCQSLQLVTKKK